MNVLSIVEYIVNITLQARNHLTYLFCILFSVSDYNYCISKDKKRSSAKKSMYFKVQETFQITSIMTLKQSFSGIIYLFLTII